MMRGILMSSSLRSAMRHLLPPLPSCPLLCPTTPSPPHTPDSLSNEDDATMKLAVIIEVNNALRMGLQKGLPMANLMVREETSDTARIPRHVMRCLRLLRCLKGARGQPHGERGEGRPCVDAASRHALLPALHCKACSDPFQVP